jgi:hypothetical protein
MTLLTAHSVDDHFRTRSPIVREIYTALIDRCRQLGDVHEDPKKTSIHLNRKSAFAGVATRSNAIILTLKSASDIENPRIIKRQHASANRWYLEVRLSAPDDVDQELFEWLRNSYEMSG